MAAMGLLREVPLQYEVADDLPPGGVLCALPALLAFGRLRHMRLFACRGLRLGLGLSRMKTVIVIAAVFGLVSLCAVAQDPKAEAPQTSSLKRISAAEAEKHYQEMVIVTGKVAQVSIRPKLVYVNLDKKHPETPLSCVVFSRATNQFGDLKTLEGKQVEIKGRIEEYRDKAQIILNSSNQLKVIEKAVEPGEAKKE